MLKKKEILLSLIICVFSFGAFAQDNVHDEFIHADPRIDSLVQLHTAYNLEHPIIDGYRIHLFIKSGNEALAKAEEVKVEFEEKYTNVAAYITFGEPYYRVRIGDFRTRLDAEKFLKKINRTYPNAWVTRDKINLPELPKYQKTEEYE